jgi:hypothetical protein
MDVKFLNEWGTIVGAVIAAITGVTSLFLQFRGKRDNFTVGSGTLTPYAGTESFMNVVSLSDHPIATVDYGFIEERGERKREEFWSFPEASEHDPALMADGVVMMRGSRFLKERNASFESGMDYGPKIIGAFAKSITQRRPKLRFSSDAGLWTRIRIRWRVSRRGIYR